MSNSTALVHRDCIINRDHLRVFCEQLGVVALHTTSMEGAKIIDTKVDTAPPRLLSALDVFIVLSSTVDLMDEDTRVTRQREMKEALEKAFAHFGYRFGVHISLNIKMRTGEGYLYGEIGEMTMEAATERAIAEIGESWPKKLTPIAS